MGYRLNILSLFTKHATFIGTGKLLSNIQKSVKNIVSVNLLLSERVGTVCPLLVYVCLKTLRRAGDAE